MLEFPEITWDQVRSCLIRNHESFTTFNVLKIINHVIRVSIINFINDDTEVNRHEKFFHNFLVMKL